MGSSERLLITKNPDYKVSSGKTETEEYLPREKRHVAREGRKEAPSWKHSQN